MTLDPMYMFQNSQGLPKCSQNSNAIQTAPNPFLGSTKLWSVQNLPANKVVLLQLLLPLLILPHMSKHLSLSSSHMEWALCGRCHPETYCYLHCKLLHCCSIVQVWNWGLFPGSCDLELKFDTLLLKPCNLICFTRSNQSWFKLQLFEGLLACFLIALIEEKKTLNFSTHNLSTQNHDQYSEFSWGWSSFRAP